MIDADDKLLRELTAAIAPPQAPIGFDAEPDLRQLPGFPPDLMKFIRTYGSGYFNVQHSFRLQVLNPFESRYWDKQNSDLDNIRKFKAEEGDDYIPYDVYPNQPGLFLWAFGQGRIHFFWLTQGDPKDWTVVAMYDLEFFTPFDCSMLSFLKQLLCGEIDCSFLGGVDTPDNCVDPKACKFVAAITPA